MTNSHSVLKVDDSMQTVDDSIQTFDDSSIESEIDESTEQLEAGNECVICYESLNATKNRCITECGHEFCLSCMMKHAQRNNGGCPMCRAVLIEEEEDVWTEVDDSGDEDDEDDIDGESTEESIDGIEDGEDLENEYHIEELESAFMAKGYGLKEALSLLMYKFSKTDAKYTKEYIRQLEADIDDMHEDLQRECEERMDMGAEDTR